MYITDGLKIFILFGLAVNLNSQVDLNGRTVTQQELDSFGKRLAQANFAGAKLEHLVFNQQDLSKANFKGAKLSYCMFNGCNLEQADFSEALLQQVAFNGVLDGLSIAGAIFDRAIIDNCTGLVDLLDDNSKPGVSISFKGAKFNDSDAKPNNKSFVGIRLLGAYDFTGATFSGSRMNFSRTEFGPRAIMINTVFRGEPWGLKMEPMDVNPSGIYDNTREGLLFFETIVNGTNFSGAQFNYVNFSFVRALGINLRKAEFNNSKILTSAIAGDLSCTKFNNCIAKVNDFTNAKINGSDLMHWIENDADGSFGTNIFTPGLTYDHPDGLAQFDCKYGYN